MSEWTKTTPKTKGWYWWRATQENMECPVWVGNTNGRLNATLGIGGGSVLISPEIMEGEWQGPIKPKD
jgi:hypothetical protein